MAHVISKLGKEVTPLGPSVIGVCEIENKQVLKTLFVNQVLPIKNIKLFIMRVQIKEELIVLLLYDPSHFKVTSSKSVRLTIPEKDDFLQEINW